jgi:hypothetical protein
MVLIAGLPKELFLMILFGKVSQPFNSKEKGSLKKEFLIIINTTGIADVARIRW